MVTYSVIRKSQLEGAMRLDAEYYQPEYLDIGKKLKISPGLDELSKKITDFGAYSQMNFVNYADKGIRFFRNQNIGEVFIDDDDLIFISDETYKRLSLKLEENDILVPRVGTLGNAAIIFKDNLPASANQNLAQIKPDISKIDPFYLSLFLCCKFGRKQFERMATGNVQPWLNLLQIKSLKIFVPPQDKQKLIKNITLESLKENKNSENLYSQAENLLLEELGLSSFAKAIEDKKDLSWAVNLSEVKAAKRMDAEYYQPFYNLLLTKIKNLPYEKITNVAIKNERGVQPSYLDGSGIFIINSQHILEQTLDYDNFAKTPENFFKNNQKAEVLCDDILFYTTGANVGRVGIYLENDKAIASNHVNILRINKKDKVNPIYLAFVLNSLVGRQQIYREVSGAAQKELYPSSISNLIFPILSQSVQQKIADLVKKSHEARKKSKELLEEAKRKVEEMIEKGKR